MTNDPRITPVGKFLRRHYLDRFPAFLNVIAGQITIFDIFKKIKKKSQFKKYKMNICFNSYIYTFSCANQT